MKTASILAVVLALLASANAAPKWHELTSEYTYEAWASEFKPHGNSKNLFAAKTAFSENMQKILNHNAGSSSYKMGVNQYSDLSSDEFVAQLGFDKASVASRLAALGEDEFDLIDNGNHPSSVDWDKRGMVPEAVSQGHCGSCWAHSSSMVVNSIAAITNGKPVNISRQAIVDCFDNVRECGGSGGCHGATAELAFSYIKDNGVPLDAEYPYVSGESRERGECRSADFETAVTMDGWKHLSANHVNELMQIVSTYGPVAVSVDATAFHQYESGVLDACARPEDKVIINHAVTLLGYGYDARLKQSYWTVRNSWGPEYGESGNLRVVRASSGSAEKCYTDDEPASGSACKDDPLTPYPVCGCVGILSNAVVPTGVKVIRNHV